MFLMTTKPRGGGLVVGPLKKELFLRLPNTLSIFAEFFVVEIDASP